MRPRRAWWFAVLALVAGIAVAAAGASIATLTTSSTSATVGCGCDTLGMYVDPVEGDAPAVTSTSLTTGTSPNGKYTLEVTGGGSTPTLTVKLGGTTVLTKSGEQWGFSPDDDRFVVWSASEVSLYDLTAADPNTAIWNGPDPSPTRLEFSPSGRWIFYTYIQGGETHLELVDAQSGTATVLPSFAPSGTGSDSDEFGTASWGFGPNEHGFVYGSVSGTDTIDWHLVDLDSGPTVVKTLSAIPIVSGFWQFSPCGDAIGLVYQPDQNNLDIELWSVADGSELGNVGPPVLNNSSVTLHSTQAAELASYEGTDYVLLDHSDCGGTTSTTSTTTTTSGGTPTASFTLPTNVKAGHAGTFTDTSTDSGGSIVSWSWHFGDGQTSTDESPSHTYTNPAGGTFTVTLTVTDGGGAQDTATRNLTVAANAPPHAAFTFAPDPAVRGASLTLTSTSTDPDGASDIVDTAWQTDTENFDGQTATIEKACPPLDVTLTVTDTTGQSDSVHETIPVSEAANVISVPSGGSLADAMARACPGDTVQLAPGTYTGGVVLDGVNLKGSGEGVSIVSGPPGQEVLTTQSRVSTKPITISDLSVRGGAGGIELDTGNAAGETDIERVEVDDNTTDGGISVDDQVPTVNVDSSHLHDNHNNASGGGFAMFCCAKVSITNSEIDHNSSNADGGGAQPFENDGVTFIGNNVHDNTARRDGGGLYLGDGFAHEPDVVTNNQFVTNTAGNEGGGAALFDETLFAGNLVAHNTGGGVSEGGDAAITDSTIVDNDGTGVAETSGSPTLFALFYNNIVGGNTTNIDTSACAAGSNAIGDSLPSFADSAFRLAPGSSAIDAGDNSKVPSELATDAFGEARIKGGTVDLGYAESGSGAGSVGAATLVVTVCDPALRETADGAAGPGSVGGATLTTDTEGDGATAADPIETTITPTVSANDHIAEVRPLGASALDLSAWTDRTQIFQSSPSASYTIAFDLDSSLVGSASPSDIVVRDLGTEVPACAGAATPNPCVSSRAAETGGDVRVTVVATPTAMGSQRDGGHFGDDTWTFAGGEATLIASTPPSITGDAVQGATLTGDEGAWLGANGTVVDADQWLRCDAPASKCVPIGSATAASYTVTADDVGRVLQFQVTATDSSSSVTADSNPTGVITAAGSGPAAPGAGGSSGSSGSGTGSGTPATSTPGTNTSASQPATPGAAGELTIGSGETAATVSWQAASFTAPVTVEVSEAPAVLSGGFTIGTTAVTLTVHAADGSAVTSFATPLELVFPHAPAGVVPAYSPDGTTWTSMPQLGSDTLPSGFHDGWYRDADNTIHIFTLHATYFGLLDNLTAAKPEFSVLFAYPRKLNASSRHLFTVSLVSSLPGELALVLRRGSSVAVKKSAAVAGTTTNRISLRLPKRLRAGMYRFTAVLTAGRERYARVVSIRVSG